MVGQATGAQSSARVEEHTEGSVGCVAEVQLDMGKPIIDAKRHGAEGRTDVNNLLAGTDEEGVIPRLLWRRRLVVRVLVGSGRSTGATVILASQPCRLVAGATAGTRGRS